MHVEAVGHLVEHDAELGADRVRHLPRDEREGRGDRMPGQDAPDDQVERFGKLAAEAFDAAPAPQMQDQERQTDRRRRGQHRRQDQRRRRREPDRGERDGQDRDDDGEQARQQT